MRVYSALRPRTHFSRDPHYELVTQPLGLGEHASGLWIEHDLQQSFAVAQVDEDHPAMIAAAMYPAGDRDRLTDELLADLSAVM